MAKTLGATCDSQGKVSFGGTVVEGAIVLSEGKQSSSGLLFLEEDLAVYIPSSATDIKTTIEKLVDTITDAAAAITKISTTLTAIGAGMTGPTTAPPPTLAVDVADLVTKVTSLNATKTSLNTLKGALK